MTSTVACVNGIGVHAGAIPAGDNAHVLTITGLSATYEGLAVTGHVATEDGHTNMAAADPTGTIASGSVEMTADLDTAAMAELMRTGRTTAANGRLTVCVTATGAVVCVAPLTIVPAAG